MAVLCAAPLPAFFSRPIPLSITSALAIVAVVALWRPAVALLILAAFVPMAGAIHVLAGAPYDSAALVEVFVLVLLGAAAGRAAIRGAPLSVTAFELAALGFIGLALASCVAQMPMILLREGVTDWRAAVSGLLLHDYFLKHPGLVVIERTAVLVEGVALAAIVARVTNGFREAHRLSGMVLAGGTAAALLNVYRLVEVALRRPPFVESLGEALRLLRFNTQYGDLNAAGSYFAMVAVLAACHAGFRTRRGWIYAAAVPLLACALWVSGSRVALVAAVLCTIAAIALRRYGRELRRFSSPLRLAAAAGFMILAFGFLIFLLPLTRHGTFQYSMSTRLELLKTGGRMVVDRPILGVGTAQYYALFPRYVSPELERAFADAVGHPVPRENAHNQFVQVLAELGVAGLASFVLVLLLALRKRGTLEPWRAGVIAALTCFLLTCLAGHPLLTPMVAYSFWIVVGLAAGSGPTVTARTRQMLAWATAAAALLLVMTVPWRWGFERRDADLAGVSLGLSPWQRDEAGTRFQSAQRKATVFVSRDSPVVRIPLRSPDQAARHVEIFLNGRFAASVAVMPDRWIVAQVPLPRRRGMPAYHRIDLVVEPSSVATSRHGAALLMVGRLVEVEP
ncbi:MAG: O-antigen ligase family protein [Acidobacteria bacterium]|nr:O-antigen ligase family protein [Acidobacteriota bacterium]